MPQFWLEDFAPQLVWFGIAFALLYVLMSKIALPRIANILEDRQGRIANDLDQAEQLKAKAEKVIADYEAALSEARAQAKSTLAETALKLAEETEKRTAEVTERLNAEAEAAANRIADAKQAAMAEVREVAIDLTQSISEKMTGEAADSEAVSRAVDNVMQGGN